MQRIGCATVSLFSFGAGLFCDVALIHALIEADLVSVESVLDISLLALASLVFLIPGALGLLNVLRF